MSTLVPNPPGTTSSRYRCVVDIPGPRWFGPTDPIWRVHASTSAPIGVATSIVMHAGHPALAATYRLAGAVDNPWVAGGYLEDLIMLSTFGTVDDAVVTIEKARRDHASFAGCTECGDFFYGSDPEIGQWSHDCTAWAMLTAYQRFSPTPLSNEESDTYVAQFARFSRLHGVKNPPLSVRELERLVRRGSAGSRPTAAGRQLVMQLRQSAQPCRADENTSAVRHHKRCTTVVEAAISLLPSDLCRTLGMNPLRHTRNATLGRLAAAHESLPSPPISATAPIGAPSAMLASDTSSAGDY